MFLAQWVGKLVATDRPLSVADLSDIAMAIDGLADLPRAQRSLAALRTFLDNTESEGIAARIKRWEAGQPLGWVFDNVEDDIGIGATFLGYDITDFLDNPEIRTPLMSYLFHRVEQLIDGQRIIIVIDEFWKALADEGFRDLAQNKLKTIRKQNGLMLFATQSPRDAIVVAKADRASREAGGVWRVHCVWTLNDERFSAFELTDETEGERLDRAAVVPGEIRIGDRAYLQPERIARVMADGGDVIVRAPHVEDMP